MALLTNLFCLTAIIFAGVNGQSSSSDMIWTHRAVLDRLGKVVLFWTPGIEDFTAELQVEAKGWIGLGFSPDGNMPNSDVVIGWVSNNEPSLQDRFASDRIEPLLDDQQDYKLLSGYENDTHTVLRFQRKYDTCDPKDMKITNDTMKVIYAYTHEDPVGSILTQHTWQGSRNLILTSMNNVVQGVIPSTKSFEMRVPNITLAKTDKTMCWQKIFKFVPPSSRDVIIGFEPLWKNVSEGAVDHVWLYKCDKNVDPLTYEHYSNDRGSVCFSENAFSQYGNCSTVFATAAAGSLSYTLPGKVGYSLNQGVDGPTYFLLKVAYNNWNTNEDIIDDTGIAIITTSDPTPFPAATLTVGHEIGLSHIVPLDQKAFTTVGHCDADCTSKNFPPDGIFVYELFFDARSNGRKMALKHIRGGTEMEPIAVDNQFDSTSQTYRMVLDPINILPGDNLVLECLYDTTHAPSTVVGGFQPDSEACRAYLNYFPKIELQSCTSSPPIQTIFEFLHTKQIAIEASSITQKDISAAHENVKLLEYVKYYNWVNTAGDFQNLTKANYTSYCNTGGENTTVSDVRPAPKIQHPYYAFDGCNTLMGTNASQPSLPPTELGPPVFGGPNGDHPGMDIGGGFTTQQPQTFDPMMGDHAHNHDEHPGMAHSNDTSNFIETHPANHSASTQAGNSAVAMYISQYQILTVSIFTLLLFKH